MRFVASSWNFSTTSSCSRRFACSELSHCLLPLCCAARTPRTPHAALALLLLVPRTQRATTAHAAPACGRLERPCTRAPVPPARGACTRAGQPQTQACLWPPRAALHTGTRAPRSGGLHTGRPTNDDARRRKDAACPTRAQSHTKFFTSKVRNANIVKRRHSLRILYQWWRNAKYDGPAMTLEEHHSWRPSTSENNFLSRNLAEPVADARLCCARAPAHRHAAPRRPRSELLTWQRLRCPKGSCIGKRGEGRWWVRSPANSQTSFSKRQKDYRKIGTESLDPFESSRGGASERHKRLGTDHCRSRTDLTLPSPPTR